MRFITDHICREHEYTIAPHHWQGTVEKSTPPVFCSDDLLLSGFRFLSDEENFGPAKPWHRAVAAPSSAPLEVSRDEDNILPCDIQSNIVYYYESS